MISEKSFDTGGWDEESLKTLAELKNDDAYFWPPDPTVTSAAVGGMIGTNAQSITDFRYGRLKEYLDEIELVDAEGRLFTTKNTELYLGSEGMYGIFTAATLRLVKEPLEMWGSAFSSRKNLRCCILRSRRWRSRSRVHLPLRQSNISADRL
jgi:D-lactate dehydrogenase (cytochrome)